MKSTKLAGKKIISRPATKHEVPGLGAAPNHSDSVALRTGKHVLEPNTGDNLDVRKR